MRINKQNPMSVTNIPDTNELHLDAGRMDNLFKRTAHMRLVWSDQDYGAILQHQLDAPLLADLVQLYPHAHPLLAETPALTFRELFLQTHPSVDMLRLVKEFAKLLNHHARSAYPEDVATVLYYSSIAAAALRTNALITSLSPTEIQKGYQWGYQLPWITEELRDLFKEALERERPSESEN